MRQNNNEDSKNHHHHHQPINAPTADTGLPYGLHIRKTGHNPQRRRSADWCVLMNAIQPGPTV
jgi:hypothetical protein